jgi:hypothetical protein
LIAVISRAIIQGLGPVAQSVEQRIENPCVGGSIPPRATNLKAAKTFVFAAFLFVKFARFNF